jgi:phosphatidylinositol glycan class B
MDRLSSLVNARDFFKIKNSGAFLCLVVAVYLVTAVNSVGFHQFDEHFQIVEFANYKMGWIERGKLAWEFKAQIRPGLQPLIAYLLFRICQLFGISNGFDLELILRVITGIFSITVIKGFIDSYEADVNSKVRPYFVFSSYLLWFLPYINVRFSSEEWSGLFFLIALTAIKRSQNRHRTRDYVYLGAILGVSILFRYQSALLSAGIALWIVLVKRSSIKDIFAFGAALLLMLCIGFMIDRWLYGQYSFTIYRYFYTNIVKDVASLYGVSPWYDIILYTVKTPGPIGIFILASFFALLVVDYKNVVLWAIIPFLIVHSVIPHKELRFLFPIAEVAPLLMALAYQHLSMTFRGPGKVLLAIIIVFLFLFNLAGLVAIVSTGASSQVAVENFIHRNYDEGRVNLILNDGFNPYIQGPPLYNTFHTGTGISMERISTFWQGNLLSYRRKNYVNLLLVTGDDYTGPQTDKLLKAYGLVRVYQNIPDIVKLIYDRYDRSLNESMVIVYEFR